MFSLPCVNTLCKPFLLASNQHYMNLGYPCCDFYSLHVLTTNFKRIKQVYYVALGRITTHSLLGLAVVLNQPTPMLVGVSGAVFISIAAQSTQREGR